MPRYFSDKNAHLIDFFIIVLLMLWLTFSAYAYFNAFKQIHIIMQMAAPQDVSSTLDWAEPAQFELPPFPKPTI